MSDDKKVKRRVHPDVVMARAQIALTVILLLAIIGLVACLVFLPNRMSDRTFSLISGTIVTLGTLLTLSWNYFFARQRQNTLPDTNNTGGNHAPISTGGAVSVARDESRVVSGTG